MQRIKFKLNGFHCEACAKLATMRLRKIDGVREIKFLDSDGNGELEAERIISKEEFENALIGTEHTVCHIE